MTKKNDIYILGVGRNTGVYIDLVEACGFNPAGLYHFNDEKIGETLYGVPILDSNENLFKNESLENIQFAISVGDNNIRQKLANKIRSKGGILPTLIHPSAVVSKYAHIEAGVVIQANTVVQAGAAIGEDTVLSYNVSVTHSSIIGKACYLAAGSNIGAYINVMCNVLIGQGAVLISSKVSSVGENSIIGAGAVVTKSVPPNSTVAGNPASVLNRN